MPGVRVETSPAVVRHKRDISSWSEGDTSALGVREKKRYNKRKNAIREYFTTDASIEEITLKNHLSEETLLKLVEKCLLRHEDGSRWGFRAMLPGTVVIDHPAVSSSRSMSPVEENSTPKPEPRALEEPTALSASSVTENERATPEIAVEEAEAQYSIEESEVVSTSDEAKVAVEESKAEHLVAESKSVVEEPEAENLVEEPEVVSVAEEPEAAVEDAEVVSVAEEPEVEDAETPGLAVEPEVAGPIEEEVADEEDTAKRLAIKPGQLLKASVPSEAATLAASEPVTLPTPEIEAESEEESNAEQTIVEPDRSTEYADEESTLDEFEARSNGLANFPTVSLAATNGHGRPSVAAVPHQLDDTLTEVDNLDLTPTSTLPGDVETADEDDSEQKLYADLEEYSPAPVDERMLPARIDDEARIAILSGAEPPDLAHEPTEMLPLVGEGHYRLTGEQKTLRTRRIRVIRKDRKVKGRKQRNRWRTILSVSILAALLIGLLTPVGAGLAAYNAYNNVKGVAEDGVAHLMKVKTLIPLDKNNPMAALDPVKLQQAQLEFRAANSDFLQLQQLVVRPDIRAAIQQFAPDYTSKLDMAKHLVQVAIDVTRMGDEMSGVGIMAAGLVHDSPLASAGTSKPLLTVDNVATIKAALVHGLYYIDDVQQEMRQVDLSQLPISKQQQGQISSALTFLPVAQNYIAQAQDALPIVSWLIGVGQHRHFLLQTMDNSELRPGGGFTGQYGIIDLQDGRLGPLSLHDVTLIDYAGNGYQMGRQPPPGYNWINFGNFGLRDSNLSGDYPTTGKINLGVFQDEGGGPVDGDIAFTPAFIGHIIDVTGPIYVKAYNETITSKNLEERLHYYQMDFSAIDHERQVTGSNAHDVRKAFTALLAKLLLEKVRQMPVKKLLDVVKGAIKDLQSRDLEIYLTNPAAEDWLLKSGYGGAMNSFKTTDGFMVVQANISISKASKYVHTTLQDDVTLDGQGGATHNLTVTLNYQQTGPVYGYDAYTDYMRIYAPPNAQFISGSGFDSGHPICGSKVPTPPKAGKPPTGGCAAYNYIPADGSRYCPSGNYSLGVRSGNFPTVNSVGPPTAMHSDMANHTMWGGLTVTPKNCISTIRASWYVPHAANKSDLSKVYSIEVDKQGGMVPTVEVNVDASALHIKGLKNLTYKGDIHADRQLVLQVPQPKTTPGTTPGQTAKPGATPINTPTPASKKR